MVRDVINAIETVLSGAGIMVFDIPPNSLGATDLPCVIIVHAGSEFSFQAVGYKRAVHRFDLYVPVEFVSQSKNTKKVNDAIDIYEDVVNSFLNNPDLSGMVDSVVKIVDNSGYSTITWGGVSIFGFVIRIEVVEKW